MAMLRKPFLAAVACWSIAFAASAFAQAGGAVGAGAGGMAGASMGATSGTGTTGTTGTSLGATSSTMGNPAGTTGTGATSNNTPANNSTTLGPNNPMGTNNTLAQNNLGVNAGPGVTNNLGTRGPAGSTSVSSAQATTTPGAGIPPNGAPALTTGGGSTNALGGNGIVQQSQTARANVSHMRMTAAENARHHRVDVNLERRREMSSMARLNAHEHNITSGLNHAQLNHVTAFVPPVNG
jgi:hypothetical protein